MIDRARFTYFRGLPAPNVSEETGNCVLLWRVVIDQIVEDLINPPRNREEVEAQKAARFWLDGNTMYDANSPGFDDVADLALIPAYMLRRKINDFLEVYCGTED